MFTGVRKDASVDTPSSPEPQPRAFNSASMMTKSQLAANARTPKAPSRGLPIIGRGPTASPVMFYHEDSPCTSHRAAAIVNVTSTSQGSQATIMGSSRGQDLLIDPTTGIENVDLRDYHSDSEGECTTIVE